MSGGRRRSGNKGMDTALKEILSILFLGAGQLSAQSQQQSYDGFQLRLKTCDNGAFISARELYNNISINQASTV